MLSEDISNRRGKQDLVMENPPNGVSVFMVKRSIKKKETGKYFNIK